MCAAFGELALLYPPLSTRPGAPATRKGIGRNRCPNCLPARFPVAVCESCRDSGVMWRCNLSATACFCLALLLVALAPAPCASVDIETVIKNRLLPAVNQDALESLDGLEEEVAAELAASQPLSSQYANLQRMLRIKNVQLEDANNVVKAVEKEHKETIEAVQKLRKVLEESHSGGDNLENQLKSEISEESKLKKRLAEDEQRIKGLKEALEDTRIKAHDPSLGKWFERRIENVGSAIDSPDSGRMLGAALGSAVVNARETVGSLEASAARRGAPSFLTGLLTFLVVVTPAAAAVWAIGRLTWSLSFRQHLVVGHIVNIFFLFACVSLTVITSYDPLITMHHSSPQHTLLLMVFFCIQWPIMLSMMLYTAYVTKNAEERQTFFAQSFLYVVVFFHVLKHTYPRILFGQPAFSLMFSNLKNYILYLVSAGSMLVLTISGAESNAEGLVGDMQNMLGDLKSRSAELTSAANEERPSANAPENSFRAAPTDNVVERTTPRFARRPSMFGFLNTFYKAE